MKLDNLTKGVIQQPFTLLLYAVEGVGKSTFGASSHNPIFISTEDGTNNLDVARFPEPQNGGEIIEAIDTLYTDDHDFQTVVLDTADWAEKLFMQDIAKEQNVEAFADIGYGKGYEYLADKFLTLVAGLNALKKHKDMNVIILAHAAVTRFDEPGGESFSRYSPATHEKRVTPILKEFVDAIGFANHDKYIKKEGSGFNERNVAKGSGQRVVYFQHAPAHDAKSRYGHPPKMNFDQNFYNEFFAIYENFFKQ